MEVQSYDKKIARALEYLGDRWLLARPVKRRGIVSEPSIRTIRDNLGTSKEAQNNERV